MAAGNATAAAGGLQSGLLTFTPLVTTPDIGFWQELTRQKLDVLRLDSSPIKVCGCYEAPPTAGAPAKLLLLRESLGEESGWKQLPAGGAFVRGTLKNFNTVEEFRGFLTGGDRTALVSETLNTLRGHIKSGAVLDEPLLLRPVHIVAFADLKKYQFAYTVALPVLTPRTSWTNYARPCVVAETSIDRACLDMVSRRLLDDSALARAGCFLLVRATASAPWTVLALSSLPTTNMGSQEIFVGFVDPSSQDDAPGWPLRNLILAIAYYKPGQHRFLAFRDVGLCTRGPDAPLRSRVFCVDATAAAAAAALGEEGKPLLSEVQLAGWTKIQNFDLTAFLDKTRMAADAVDLNVKLMKWRLLPNLEPERIQQLRFLLLGAGTLGCHVARTLMGWGVRHMTFVDSGHVSLSNPVRQTLFTHRDAAECRSKVLAASEAVKAVMPDAEVAGIELEIPMPGHPHQSREALKATVQRLQALVEGHDVVCMLTDSRESRWLPSLLVAAAQQAPVEGSTAREGSAPLGLTVALGFDSFLVSRQTHGDAKSACYFCNDVTAPADSLAFRTLDQQCTVTRPGLAGLASNVAVELVAALAQHPDGFRASSSVAAGAPAASLLGAVPHQVRGYLADFRLAPAETEPFTKCICCSEAVMQKYAEERLAFVEQITSDSAVLEEISGLAAMKAAVTEEDVLAFDEFDEDI